MWPFTGSGDDPASDKMMASSEILGVSTSIFDKPAADTDASSPDLSVTPVNKSWTAEKMRQSSFPFLDDEPFPRLNTITPKRVALGSATSGLIGFGLGVMQGGQMAQLRFRAEHAHKMPDTTTGWYFYHKSKNYHAMQGGIREGLRMGAKTGVWTFLALGLESTVDRWRGRSDMFSTIIATMTVAGAFSTWRKFFFGFSLFAALFSRRCLVFFRNASLRWCDIAERTSIHVPKRLTHD